MKTPHPQSAPADRASRARLRAVATMISLGMASLAASWILTGGFQPPATSPGARDFTGSIGGAMLALALLPLGVWAKTARGTLAWAIFSFAATAAAIIIPLAGA